MPDKPDVGYERQRKGLNNSQSDTCRSSFMQNLALKGSVRSYRALQSNDRSAQPNVWASGHAVKSVEFSVFREWLLTERSPSLPRCAAACPLRAHTGSAPAQTLASAAIRTPKLLAAPQREKQPFVVGAAKSRWATTELWDKLTFDLDY
jgi:hypothetical protein